MSGVCVAPSREVTRGAAASVWLGAGDAFATTASFTVPGNYSFLVPVGVTSVAVIGVGAAGGGVAGRRRLHG